jgi:hypothetical protein
MMDKYDPFTPPPPKNIYISLGALPISYWDIVSQIRCTLANPEATTNAT